MSSKIIRSALIFVVFGVAIASCARLRSRKVVTDDISQDDNYQTDDSYQQGDDYATTKKPYRRVRKTTLSYDQVICFRVLNYNDDFLKIDWNDTG